VPSFVNVTDGNPRKFTPIRYRKAEGLAVYGPVEAPLEVLDRGLVQVLLNVPHRVLRNVPATTHHARARPLHVRVTRNTANAGAQSPLYVFISGSPRPTKLHLLVNEGCTIQRKRELISAAMRSRDAEARVLPDVPRQRQQIADEQPHQRRLACAVATQARHLGQQIKIKHKRCDIADKEDKVQKQTLD